MCYVVESVLVVYELPAVNRNGVAKESGLADLRQIYG